MTIIFDYDGTLHNSAGIYIKAFRKAYRYLVEAGQAEDRTYSDGEISRWLGYTKVDMWNSFMPELEESYKEKAGGIIGEEMRRLIRIGEAALYEGTVEVLEYLKSKRHKLMILSNCSEAYLLDHMDMFSLVQYMERCIATESYDFISKTEIVRSLIEGDPSGYMIIGDRHHDIDAGLENGIRTVGCSYGYGTPEEYDRAEVVIGDIRELIGMM